MSVCLCLSAAGPASLLDSSHCISNNNQPTVEILTAHLASKTTTQKIPQQN